MTEEQKEYWAKLDVIAKESDAKYAAKEKKTYTRIQGSPLGKITITMEIIVGEKLDEQGITRQLNSATESMLEVIKNESENEIVEPAKQ